MRAYLVNTCTLFVKVNQCFSPMLSKYILIRANNAVCSRSENLDRKSRLCDVCCVISLWLPCALLEKYKLLSFFFISFKCENNGSWARSEHLGTEYHNVFAVIPQKINKICLYLDLCGPKNLADQVINFKAFWCWTCWYTEQASQKNNPSCYKNKTVLSELNCLPLLLEIFLPIYLLPDVFVQNHKNARDYNQISVILVQSRRKKLIKLYVHHIAVWSQSTGRHRLINFVQSVIRHVTASLVFNFPLQ